MQTTGPYLQGAWGLKAQHNKQTGQQNQSGPKGPCSLQQGVLAWNRAWVRPGKTTRGLREEHPMLPSLEKVLQEQCPDTWKGDYWGLAKKKK